MECVDCGSAAVSERRDRTAQGYRRFRCRDCGWQFNERSGGVLNRTQYPSDVIALVVLWRLRYRLTLQDLSEMFLQRGIVFSHEAVRDWEMPRFKSPGQAQRFLSSHGIIYGHFRPRRHLMAASEYRRCRAKAFQIWRQETCAQIAA
jgi:hypothetical protein